jgi:hypothetical protein
VTRIVNHVGLRSGSMTWDEVAAWAAIIVGGVGIVAIAVFLLIRGR